MYEHYTVEDWLLLCYSLETLQIKDEQRFGDIFPTLQDVLFAWSKFSNKSNHIRDLLLKILQMRQFDSERDMCSAVEYISDFVLSNDWFGLFKLKYSHLQFPMCHRERSWGHLYPITKPTAMYGYCWPDLGSKHR